jgi:hypothetical protein
MIHQLGGKTQAGEEHKFGGGKLRGAAGKDLAQFLLNRHSDCGLQAEGGIETGA